MDIDTNESRSLNLIVDIRKKSLGFVFSLFIYFTFFATSTLAQENTLKVTGFGSGRTRYVLADKNGGPPPGFYFPTMSRLYGALTSVNNFGTKVACQVTKLNTLVSYVYQDSLVDENNIPRYDVFFGPPIDTALSQEEASEIAKFVINGGVLYVGGTGWQDSTPGQGYEYNLLFETLGIPDRFDTFAPATGIMETAPAYKSRVSEGPFGIIGTMKLNSYRRFINQSMNGVVYKDNPSDFVILERRIGKGYLVATGEPLFTNGYKEMDNDNFVYFLNLFAMGCDKSWQDNSVVLDVPSFKQNDPQWADEIYDDALVTSPFCGQTMAQCGCALTSATMVAKYHKMNMAPGGVFVNPSIINSFANGALVYPPPYTPLEKGFVEANFRWHFLQNLSADAASFNDQKKVQVKLREDYSLERIKELIDDGLPVVLQVSGDYGIHWVVVTGYDPISNRLIINDPIAEDPPFGEHTYLDSNYTPIASNSMVVYEQTMSDFRLLQFGTRSTNHLLVTDSHGNKTGFDPESGLILEEIPESEYVLDYDYGDPTGDGQAQASENGVYFLTIMLPEDGEYKLKISSRDGNAHPVNVYSSDTEGGLAGKVISPTAAEENYTFVYNEETAGHDVNGTLDEVAVEVLEAKIDIEPFVKNNIVIPHKWFPVPVAILASDNFDPAQVEKTSISFGKVGSEKSLIMCLSKLVDVNRDKKKDLMCYFSADKLGVGTGDRELIINGAYGDKLFTGKDSIKVFKPWFLF